MPTQTQPLFAPTAMVPMASRALLRPRPRWRVSVLPCRSVPCDSHPQAPAHDSKLVMVSDEFEVVEDAATEGPGEDEEEESWRQLEEAGRGEGEEQNGRKDQDGLKPKEVMEDSEEGRKVVKTKSPMVANNISVHESQRVCRTGHLPFRSARVQSPVDRLFGIGLGIPPSATWCNLYWTGSSALDLEWLALKPLSWLRLGDLPHFRATHGLAAAAGNTELRGRLANFKYTSDFTGRAMPASRTGRRQTETEPARVKRILKFLSIPRHIGLFQNLDLVDVPRSMLAEPELRHALSQMSSLVSLKLSQHGWPTPADFGKVLAKLPPNVQLSVQK